MSAAWAKKENVTLPVTIEDVRAAMRAIAPSIVRTPILKSVTLSQLCGCDIYVKFENLQFTAAYKERGALNKLLSLPADQRAKGVIAMSAGNHAQGVAYHAHRLGIPATIVMPAYTPYVKVRQTRDFGAEVVLHGNVLEEATAKAYELARERGLTFIHPFDDPVVIAGQGTVALEILEAVPDLDTLVIPVGGGGLISGMAVAARAINPNIRIYGVETELYPSLVQTLRGEPVKAGGATVAEGIAVKEPGKVTIEIVRQLVDDILIVPEAAIESAVSLLMMIEKTVVEGAGAAGLAAVRCFPDLFRGRKVGLVLTGGNIDARVLAEILNRDLVRQGRIARVRVLMTDRPGELARVAAIVGNNGANVLEVQHQRLFSDVGVKEATLDLVIETRDAGHMQDMIRLLQADGYTVRLLDNTTP